MILSLELASDWSGWRLPITWCNMFGFFSPSMQALFLRWLITVFDFIDRKEDLRALYGFFFFFLQEEKMVRRAEEYMELTKT